MAIRFGTINLVDSASLAASSEVSGYSKDNVKSDLLMKTWKPTANPSWIKFTPSGACNMMGIIGTGTVTFSVGGVAKISNVAITANKPMCCFFDSSSSEAKWDFTGTVPVIGRLFLGTAVAPTKGLPLEFERERVNLSVMTRSRGGVPFVDENPKFWKMGFQAAFETDAVVETLRDGLESYGMEKTMWAFGISGDITLNTAYYSPKVLFSRMTEPYKEKFPYTGLGTVSFGVEEAL